MTPIGNVPPLGLTAAVARALREGVDTALDALLDKATVTVAGGRAVERDVVEIVRRWAARREEELFPGPAEDLLEEPTQEVHAKTGGIYPAEVCENDTWPPRCGPVTHLVTRERLVGNDWERFTSLWVCARCADLFDPCIRMAEQATRVTIETFEALGLPLRTPPDPGSVVGKRLHDDRVLALEEDRCPQCLWVKGKRTMGDPFCRTCARDEPQTVCSCCGFRSSWSGAIWHDADGKTVCEGCWGMPGAGAG
jgi:hypothetical protein